MDQQDKHKRRRLQDLLRNYLEEDISPEDKQLITRWLEREQSSHTAQPTADERIGKDVLQRIQAKLNQEERNNTGKQLSRGTAFRIAAAAALFLFIGIGTYMFQQKQATIHQHSLLSKQAIQWDSVVTAPGQRVKVRLPDSSILYVHGNSKLRYDAQLNTSDARNIYLDQGEAFFEVTHRPQQPFVVHTPYTSNKVLGTSFNIQLRGDDGFYHLSVNTGAVEFAAKKDSALTRVVSKGNHLVFDESKVQFRVVAATPSDFSAWKDNVLVLDNNNWLQVAAKLRNWFGVTLHVSPQLVETHYFTATFEEATLKKVLTGLQHINAFDYEIRGKEVFIE